MIRRFVQLSCDREGCTVAYPPTPAELTSLRLSRTGARKAGWSRWQGLDFCPEHGTGRRLATIRDLAAKHYDDGSIAARLGLTRGYVQQLRSDAGIPAGVRPGRPACAGSR